MTERQQAKRRRILDAAGKVFADKGYEHSSIRDVSISAGVADGTIYNYFKSKQDLMEALIAELIGGLGQAESRPLELDERATLTARILVRMQTLHSSYEQMAAVLPVILGSSELRTRFRDSFLGPVARNLESELDGPHSALTSRMLLAAVLGFQVLLLLGDEATQRAWADPSELAPLWSGFIETAERLSKA